MWVCGTGLGYAILVLFDCKTKQKQTADTFCDYGGVLPASIPTSAHTDDKTMIFVSINRTQCLWIPQVLKENTGPLLLVWTLLYLSAFRQDDDAHTVQVSSLFHCHHLLAHCFIPLWHPLDRYFGSLCLKVSWYLCVMAPRDTVTRVMSQYLFRCCPQEPNNQPLCQDILTEQNVAPPYLLQLDFSSSLNSFFYLPALF